MRSALLALLVAAAALAAREGSETNASTVAEEREVEQEDESDSAPFMIVVEHSDGRRCGGSLVSLRTALTSAWCVRGDAGAEPRELWALAPGAGAVRRVARVALAAGAGDGAMEPAVLELEAPFGGGARPILMATQAAECAARAACQVVRALARPPPAAPRLRIVDATLEPADACAPRAPGWPGLCLAGPALCPSDWGAGVVCGGKLCGVLSRSVRAADGSAESCGSTHVAQSVARWRRFLHCAHTLRACGSGGECAALCSERRLLELADGEAAGGALDTALDPDTPSHHTSSLPALSPSSPQPANAAGATPPTRSPAPPLSAAPAAPPSSQPSPRPAFEFEPNRPDFKAGEYGENGADYGGDDAPPPPSTGAPASTAAPAPALASPAAREGALQARVSPAAAARPQRSAAAPPRVAALLVALLAITNLAK